MIPLTLSLKNFLSYGSDLQTINFTPYSFICLSGKNGHGKSALLDAMTWAVWGQARKIASATRADENLLRLGQKSMVVIFEFMCRSTHYRIKREFHKSPTKGTITLDFGFMGSDNHCTPLTTKAVKDTQELIIKTIGLDFDTFVNSAFLRQGGSNEFSKKSPKERKEIIGRILSLDQYEIIKKHAMEKTRLLASEIEFVRQSQEKRRIEIKEYETIPQTLSSLLHELNSSLEKEHIQRQQLVALEHESKTIQSAILDSTTELSIAKEHLKEKETLIQQLHHLRMQWKQVHQKKIQALHQGQLKEKQKYLQMVIAAQETLLDSKLKLTQEIIDVENQKRILSMQIVEARLKTQEQYTAIKEPLSAEKKITESRIQHLLLLQNQEQHNKEKYVKEYTKTQEEKSKELQQEKTITFYTKLFEKRSFLYQKILSLSVQINTQINELNTKCNLLNEDTNSTCPLCTTSLDEIKKNQCITSLNSEKTICIQKKNKLGSLKTRLEQTLQKQDAFKKMVSLHTAKQESLNFTIQQLTFKIQQCELQKSKCHEELTTLQNNMHALIVRIDETEKTFLEKIALYNNNEHIQSIEKTLNRLQQELNQNVYDESIHMKSKEDLKVLELSTYDHALLDGKLFSLKEHIITLCTLIRNKKINTAIESLITIITDLKIQENECIHRIKNNKELLTIISQKKELLLQEKGTLEAQKKHLDNLVKTIQEDEEKLKKLQKLMEEYTLIAHATGKDGIQALIIEQAIPEIEYEANVLLGRLSNNQMHIMIESLKDLKSGKTKETLDIKISDGEGVRNYELFSGGEAFRIDLSLRIAISKLLANRAGTTLQTLIIDEGFGSQDEEGTSHIIDALYKIQEDFQKIIIVSHLNTIKEHIPVHFMVQKTILGSTVSVIEQ